MINKEQEYIKNALEICKRILAITPCLGNRADDAIKEIILALHGEKSVK